MRSLCVLDGRAALPERPNGLHRGRYPSASWADGPRNRLRYYNIYDTPTRCEVIWYKQEVLQLRSERADFQRDVALKTVALERQLRESRAVTHRFVEEMQELMRLHGSVLLKSKVQTNEPSTRPKPSPLMESVEVQRAIETLKRTNKLPLPPSPEAANAPRADQHLEFLKSERRLEFVAIETEPKQMKSKVTRPVNLSCQWGKTRYPKQLHYLNPFYTHRTPHLSALPRHHQLHQYLPYLL